MKTQAYKIFLLFLAVACFGGCAIHYIPDPTASTKFGDIDEFVSTNSITLINDQPFSDDINLVGRIYVNLQKWTDVAIDITHNQLSKRGMTITNNSEKKLKMSIIDVSYKNKFSHMECQASLRVETEEGYVNTYVGTAGSAFTRYRALDGSVIRVVAAMLRDPAIVKYLTE